MKKATNHTIKIIYGDDSWTLDFEVRFWEDLPTVVERLQETWYKLFGRHIKDFDYELYDVLVD